MYQPYLEWFYRWLPAIEDRLLDWFPMLLLIAVWVYFLRKIGREQNRNKYQLDFMDEVRKQNEEARKQNETLERIAATLEKRGG